MHAIALKDLLRVLERTDEKQDGCDGIGINLRQNNESGKICLDTRLETGTSGHPT